MLVFMLLDMDYAYTSFVEISDHDVNERTTNNYKIAEHHCLQVNNIILLR